MGIALAVLGALASVVFAVAMSGSAAEAQVPTLASSAIAWGAGVTLAFGASLRAIRRDHDDGVVALVRARGASVAGYVRGRVGGLVLVLAMAIGGAVLVASLAAISLARPTMPALRSSAAALVYALVFAATMGPLAMAALGARTRAGGYLTLVAILVLPELLAPWTAALLPRGWHELTSIPAALAAVRAGVAFPVAMGASMARALAGLVTIVALSLLAVGARVRATSAGPPS